jgi:hypothetical protein
MKLTDLLHGWGRALLAASLLAAFAALVVSVRHAGNGGGVLASCS